MRQHDGGSDARGPLSPVLPDQRQTGAPVTAWQRASRQCDLDDMESDLAGAITQWLASRGVAPGHGGRPLAACETRSRLVGRRGLAAVLAKEPRRLLSGALLTTHWLVWASSRDDRRPVVGGVELAHCGLRDYRSETVYSMAPDSGLLVSGPLGRRGRRETVHLGIADDQAGRAFQSRVLQTWRAAARGDQGEAATD